MEEGLADCLGIYVVIFIGILIYLTTKNVIILYAMCGAVMILSARFLYKLRFGFYETKSLGG